MSRDSEKQQKKQQRIQQDVSSPVKKSLARARWYPVPLKGTVMVTAIVGFLLSVYLIENVNFRLAFMLVFTAMFIASLISMTKAPVIEK